MTAPRGEKDMDRASRAARSVPADERRVRPEEFGKDHWSLLAYIETLVVDGIETGGAVGRARSRRGPAGLGVIDRDRVRCNPARHPLLLGPRQTSDFRWKPEWGTRLRGYFDAPEDQRATLRLPDHDDWDCLEDLDAAGLVEFVTLTSGGVLLTEDGLRMAARLRAHKANGGHFATFNPAAASPTSPSPARPT